MARDNVRGFGFGLGELPRIAHGKGSYVFDEAGKRYLDGSGGPALFCIGHGNTEVNAAIAGQMSRIAYGYRYTFTSDALEDLTARLLRLAGGGYTHVIYTSSGSEAIESALKIALQHFSARELPRKRHFIARDRSYHGNTLGALSISGFAERRKPFVGSLLDASFVSAANGYRLPADVSSENLVGHLARELDQHILSIGAENVAAFIFEPVVGAAGGVVPAPEGYAKAIAAVCRRHDVLLIADEVMCGSGRCGPWRALEQDGVLPDITAVAKGLAGGYMPLGAILFTADVGAPIRTGHGSFMTGHTFTGHTAACAAGVAVQTVIEREHLLDRVRVVGERFRRALESELGRYDEVGDVRGRGFFVGVEMVKDRGSKTPFEAARGLNFAIGRHAFADGLIVYPCSGNVDGIRGDTIVLAPPFNATDGELELIIQKLSSAIGSALADPA